MPKTEDSVSLEVMLNTALLTKVLSVIVVHNINIGFYICLSETLKVLVLTELPYNAQSYTSNTPKNVVKMSLRLAEVAGLAIPLSKQLSFSERK